MALATGLRDRNSFAALVNRHQSRVRGYLRQLTRDPALADDLAQETFIRAWDKLSKFSGKGQFLSWLLAIAHREFLQSLRKRERTERLHSALEAESSTDDGLGTSALAEPDSDVADLPKLLSVLSEQERIALVLAYGYGLSHAEITEISGMALGTIKSHIHRGKARIQQQFDLEQFDHA